MLHVLPVSAEPKGVFTLSDRTEARLRAPDPITNAAALDVDTVVEARVVWASRSTTFVLANLPRLTTLDLNGSARAAAVADSAIVSAEWHSAHAQIRLSENATYGQQSFESIAVLPAPGSTQPSPPGQPPPMAAASLVPPTSQPLLFASSETTLDSALLLRPWNITGRVGYHLSGGGDDTSRQKLPFGQGPLAQATADYRFAGPDRDHLATTASAFEASFSSGTENVLAIVDEQWRHRWARRTATSLGAGWYLSRGRSASNAPDEYASAPVAEASLDQAFAHGKDRGGFQLEVRLSPVINVLTGLVDEQVRASVQGNWQRGRLTVRGFASAGESADPNTPSAVRQLVGELDTAYAPSKWWTVDGGVRGLVQVQNISGANGAFVESTFAQVGVFLAVSVQPVKVRF
jgi:hypothetical protein